MALELGQVRGNIEVVSSRDAAVKAPGGDYGKYLESFRGGKGDESLLKLEGEPTRFVLRKVLSFEGSMDVKDRQLDMNTGKPVVRTSFTMETVRHALIAIKNPDGAASPMEFKAVDGAADPDLVAELEAFGIVNELYLAHLHATSGIDPNLKKK